MAEQSRVRPNSIVKKTATALSIVALGGLAAGCGDDKSSEPVADKKPIATGPFVQVNKRPTGNATVSKQYNDGYNFAASMQNARLNQTYVTPESIRSKEVLNKTTKLAQYTVATRLANSAADYSDKRLITSINRFTDPTLKSQFRTYVAQDITGDTTETMQCSDRPELHVTPALYKLHTVLGDSDQYLSYKKLIKQTASVQPYGNECDVEDPGYGERDSVPDFVVKQQRVFDKGENVGLAAQHTAEMINSTRQQLAIDMIEQTK